MTENKPNNVTISNAVELLPDNQSTVRILERRDAERRKLEAARLAELERQEAAVRRAAEILEEENRSKEGIAARKAEEDRRKQEEEEHGRQLEGPLRRLLQRIRNVSSWGGDHLSIRLDNIIVDSVKFRLLFEALEAVEEGMMFSLSLDNKRLSLEDVEALCASKLWDSMIGLSLVRTGLTHEGASMICKRISELKMGKCLRWANKSSASACRLGSADRLGLSVLDLSYNDLQSLQLNDSIGTECSIDRLFAWIGSEDCPLSSLKLCGTGLRSVSRLIESLSLGVSRVTGIDLSLNPIPWSELVNVSSYVERNRRARKAERDRVTSETGWMTSESELAHIWTSIVRDTCERISRSEKERAEGVVKTLRKLGDEELARELAAQQSAAAQPEKDASSSTKKRGKSASKSGSKPKPKK